MKYCGLGAELQTVRNFYLVNSAPEILVPYQTFHHRHHINIVKLGKNQLKRQMWCDFRKLSDVVSLLQWIIHD